MAQDSRAAGASRVAWGVTALLAAAAAVMLLLLLTANRADAALLPEPVSGAIEGVAGPPTAPNAGDGVTDPVATAVNPVLDPVVHTVAPVVDPVVQTAASIVDPVVQNVVQTVEPVTGAATQTLPPVVQPIVGPVVDTVAPVLAPVMAPITNTVEAPRGTNSSPSAMPAGGGDHAPPPASPTTETLPDAGAISTATTRSMVPATSVTSGIAVMPATSDAPPLAPNDRPTPASPSPARPVAPSHGLDTSRVLELLLYAVAATFAALVLARGRRVLQFGAVKPRLAFVSLIERPG